MNRWMKYGLVSFILLLCFSVAILTFEHFQSRNLLTGVLRVDPLPSSIRGVSCETGSDGSDVQTDIVTNCFLDIEPIEFTDLLAGREYVESPLSKPQSARSLAMWLRAPGGPSDFEAETTFEFLEQSNGQIVRRILVIPSVRQDRAVVQFFEE